MRLRLSLLSLLVLLFTACEPDEPKEPEFDREAMLENLGENLIVPAYQEFANEAATLQTEVAAFAANPTEANLTTAREALKSAWLAWQHVGYFEFGPAMEVGLRANVNTFPTDSTKIENNISSGSWNLATATNITAKGLPALDYLLNSGTASEVVAEFTGNQQRQEYAQDLTQDIAGLTAMVLQMWDPGRGNYLAEFIAAQGTDIGSSLGMLVNELNFEWEITKNARVGIPLGVKTLGVEQPEKVEARWGGYSAELAFENVKAAEDIFLGRSLDGTNGLGLDDYLDHLEAQYQGGALSTAIKNQLQTAKEKLTAVPDPLQMAIMQQQSVVQEAYEALQKQVVLFKTDMASALAVQITYQDNDGD